MRDYTDITILLDRSGSMEKIHEATVSGLNAFIKEQKEVPGDGCWSLVQFDAPMPEGFRHYNGSLSTGPGDWYIHTWECVPQEKIQPIKMEDFVPRGGTALIAAACQLIDETGKRLADTPEHLRPSRVLFVIMTDGEENSSHLLTHYGGSEVYNKETLNRRITHQREHYKWMFVFLGANQDAIATAGAYGIAAGSAFTYQHDAAGTRAAYGKVSAGTRNWKLDGNTTAENFLSSAAPDDKKVEVNVKVTQ